MRLIPCIILATLLLIFLGLVASHSSAQTPRGSTTDEDELRYLAERLYKSMEITDDSEYQSLWSSRAKDKEWRLNPEQFTDIRVRSFAIRKVVVTGDSAKVYLKAHMSAVNKRTGQPARGYFGRDFVATLHCAKEVGTWRILEMAFTTAEFATELAAAESDDSRKILLAENQELISSDLASGLFSKATEQAQYDFQKSEALFQLAIQIAMQVGDKEQLSNLYNALAVAYGSRGDQIQELEYYLKSLEISSQLDPKARSNYVWGNLGTVYAEQGNYAQALEAYKKGLNPDRPQSWVLRNIAEACKNMGDYACALEHLNKSLKIAEQLKPKAGRDEAIAGSLMGIGRVHLAQGNYQQAIDTFEKALGIAEAATNLGNRGLIPSLLNSLARVYMMQGNPRQALPFLERALDRPRAETAGPGGDLEILPTAGRAYREVGDLERARQLLNRAIAGSEYRRSHAAGGAENRQRYFEQLVIPYHEMIKLLVAEKSFDDAFAYAERSKARALLDVLQSGRGEINKSLTTEEQKRDVELRRKVGSLNLELEALRRNPKSDKARIPVLENSLEQARREYESFQTNLYVVHPELSVSRGELKPITLTETATLHNSKTALLEFVVTDERTYLFVITKSDSSAQPLLKLYSIDIKQNDLSTQVERYRAQLAKRDADFLKSARELFDLLLNSAQGDLQDKTSLIIVPDGVLWDLPFQALQSDKRRYLIESHTIFYAPSLTALREMTRQGNKRLHGGTPRLDLVAFGNPVNGPIVRERIKTGLMDYALEPLPEAEKQVVALARLYGSSRTKVYTGASATEARAKVDVSSSRIIQFATHGILNSNSPMYSHLVLSQPDKNEAEDGLLEAWEIMKLDLNADLVVLAACETARGRVGAGEGMIGMAWAFFVAGSPTTVASQWKVESASTTQLMLEFHRNLRANTQSHRTTKARALQLAAFKLMKTPEYRHPFYWAGFVLVGDGF